MLSGQFHLPRWKGLVSELPERVYYYARRGSTLAEAAVLIGIPYEDLVQATRSNPDVRQAFQVGFVEYVHLLREGVYELATDVETAPPTVRFNAFVFLSTMIGIKERDKDDVETLGAQGQEVKVWTDLADKAQQRLRELGVPAGE